MCSELLQMCTDFLKYKWWLLSSHLWLLQPLLGSVFAHSQRGYRGVFFIHDFKNKYICLEVNICYISFQFYPVSLSIYTTTISLNENYTIPRKGLQSSLFTHNQNAHSRKQELPAATHHEMRSTLNLSCFHS